MRRKQGQRITNMKRKQGQRSTKIKKIQSERSRQSTTRKEEILKKAELALRCLEIKSDGAQYLVVFVAIKYYSKIKFWSSKSMKRL